MCIKNLMGQRQNEKVLQKEVLQSLVQRTPELTLIDVIEALDKIERNDAIQIITQRFPGTVGECGRTA